MALCDEQIREYAKRLLKSRMRILSSHGFYGLLLMHMRFAVDEETPTACTNGEKITFGTAFLDELSDSELDFIMMHEILHVVLQHCFRFQGPDYARQNIACDIVVNSNILLENNMNIQSITLQKYGASMHLAPNSQEGHLYTAEEVFQMFPPSKTSKSNESGERGATGQDSDKSKLSTWDDHTHWGEIGANEILQDIWEKRLCDAVEAISIKDPSNNRGTIPAFAKRRFDELKKPQTDWRTVLNEFVQEEICDYSFSPPDRRFGDSPFFLPDFNEKDDTVENILFMIDTSGSMSDDMITAAYSEIKGAIDQFNGKLKGWLGFFDAAIVEPKPFESESEFRLIRPVGGGGTDFSIIFEYVKKFMENPPASIIILTDGYAPFPPQKSANDIPVLWLLNNEDVTPPWGKITRIKV